MEGESDEDDTLYEARSLRRSEVTHLRGGGDPRFSPVLGSALVDLGCPGRVLWSSWWADVDLVDVVCLLDDDLSCWCRAWIRAGWVAQ